MTTDLTKPVQTRGEMTNRELIHGAITQQWTTGLALIVTCALLTLFAAVTGK